MATLHDDDVELLTGKNFAHFAAIRPDGTPHVTRHLDRRRGRRRPREHRGRTGEGPLRPPGPAGVGQRCTTSEDPYRWLRVDGVVEGFVTGPEADAHIDALNRRYHDGEAMDVQRRAGACHLPDHAAGRILRRYDG